MLIYLAHNWETGESMEIAENEYEKYLQEFQAGTIELIETYEIDE